MNLNSHSEFNSTCVSIFLDNVCIGKNVLALWVCVCVFREAQACFCVLISPHTCLRYMKAICNRQHSYSFVCTSKTALSHLCSGLEAHVSNYIEELRTLITHRGSMFISHELHRYIPSETFPCSCVWLWYIDSIKGISLFYDTPYVGYIPHALLLQTSLKFMDALLLPLLCRVSHVWILLENNLNSIVDIVVPILIVCEYRIHSSLVTLVGKIDGLFWYALIWLIKIAENNIWEINFYLL